MGAGVMQNIYPLFERNQTLKKEMLWSLRDYIFAHARVKYQEYGQGILTGCSLSIQGEEIAVRPGLLKYGQAVCIMMEEARIPFGAAQEMRYLHMAVREDRSAPDYIAYRMELALSGEGCEERAWPRRWRRMGGEMAEYMDMRKVYGALRRILEQSGRGEERPGGRREKRKILVD